VQPTKKLEARQLAARDLNLIAKQLFATKTIKNSIKIYNCYQFSIQVYANA
jgi:hypothetical protein